MIGGDVGIIGTVFKQVGLQCGERIVANANDKERVDLAENREAAVLRAIKKTLIGLGAPEGENGFIEAGSAGDE